jgi:hypothetical protein
MTWRFQWPEGYAEYHKDVVNACCVLMGEEHRAFFENECTYLDEFADGDKPEDVAQAQLEAI